jgi:hypothetical protein
MAMAAASIVMVIGSLFLAGPAFAQPVESGSFSLTSDPDDPIAGGQPYSYDTTAGDEMAVIGDGDDNHSIDAEIDGTDGNRWHLSLYGPAGEALALGTYTVTTANGTPAINLWRPSNFCWGLGSFTISKIEWGPSGYVHALDASFEYHCWGEAPAVRGQVHILNPPPPPVLKVGLTVADYGTVSELNGSANLHGTVRCNKAADLDITGTILQTREGQRVQSDYFQEVACTPGVRVAWTATAIPPEGMTFHKGHARTTSQVSGIDTDYDTLSTGNDATTVSLTNQKT